MEVADAKINKKRKKLTSPQTKKKEQKGEKESRIDKEDIKSIEKEESEWIKRMKTICKRAERPNALEGFPEEIISMIFGYLTWKDLFKIGRVSAWFYCYVNSPLPQWSRIDITKFSEEIKEAAKGKSKHQRNDQYWKTVKQTIKMYARFGKEAVVSLKFCQRKISGSRKITPFMDEILEVLTYHCPNIEELGLAFCKISEDSLVRMIEKSSKLVKLYFKGTPISEKVLKSIADKGQCEALDISAQGKYDDFGSDNWTRGLPFSEDGFYLLGQACRNTLKVIRLKRTSFQNRKVLEDFFKTCKKLERVSAGMSIVDDAMIKVLVESNPNITHLKILLSKVTDDGLVTISKTCDKLLFLDAKFNEGTTPSAIDMLTKGVCKDLQFLLVYLPDIPPHHLISIFEAFPKLIKLDIAQSMLDDDTLKKIAELHPKTLSLNVSETNLSMDGIKYLASFEDLVELTIGVENITDSLISNIPKACPKLRSLRIRQESISEETAKKLIRSMTHLKELEFISDESIPSKRLEKFSKKVNPNLKLIMDDVRNFI
eukprot:TRINITY_DN4554_c0_g1_i1.p1 TRINITY_DN4554_c0_g1~~TRINITY_DN4554_c0_g1_i1.p1  ORF type:complete len:543 (-),score=108.45 TRINITY_DN4554_c0_g1_i1:156-1784(-)